nr:protoporphyrinogen oxidase [Gemmatimonadota bacterium]NIQ59028.1 protoporphyrinogen oxidase [Gemmatimonadota bacterium]NIU79236.1 protoporphyrinogen oxidase [Gammaproteobacteria bacterium]NIX47915.1 protoporphyrinogen oxidase [Gemmatimonadota bacterium]NIY12287.1 protoporphyrinogen oxidase [Gemmatimonadota bacterium]
MIAVIGGGVSGLAVGYFLDRAGIDVRVLESEPLPGGVIRTARCGDQVLDLGPQRLRLTTPVRQVVDALGLADDLVPAPELPLYIHVDGRLRRVPLDMTTALTTDLLSWRDRIRALAEPFTVGLRPDEMAADFFIRKFGRRTYRRVIAPLYGDLYASDPADMPARHALAGSLETLRIDGSLLRAMLRAFRARKTVPACSFRGGLQSFTDAMARALGERLRLDAHVSAVRRDGARLRVGGDGLDLLADGVVLACPADAAARIMGPLDAPAAEALARLRYNPIAVVHLRSRVDLPAMGFQVPLDSGRATRGITANHAMFGQDGLYTAFLGGAVRRDVPDRTDDEIGALAAEEFEAMTGAPARPLHVHRTRMPAWDGSWTALE